MRNVTTFTKFLGNDPVVIEIDDILTYKGIFKDARMIPARTITSKNIVVLDFYINEGGDMAIFFGLHKKDSTGLRILQRPLYYMSMKVMFEYAGKNQEIPE